MFEVRRARDRGISKLVWLESFHSFSYGDFYDPEHLKFQDLRVLNHHLISPAQGFHAQHHRNMEMLTYVVHGVLEHSDSLGNHSRIGRHGVQRLSAGTGVTHSEVNPSEKALLEVIEIWILPKTKKLEPQYQHNSFPIDDRRGEFVLVASYTGDNNSLAIDQNVSIYASLIEANNRISYAFDVQRYGWLQVIAGAVEIGGLSLEKGDGVKIKDESIINLSARSDAEIVLFDLE